MKNKQKQLKTKEKSKLMLKRLKRKKSKNKSADKNNHSTSTKIFNDLIEKRTNIMNELHGDVDLYKIYYEYEDHTKDKNFNDY